MRAEVWAIRYLFLDIFQGVVYWIGSFLNSDFELLIRITFIPKLDSTMVYDQSMFKTTHLKQGIPMHCQSFAVKNVIYSLYICLQELWIILFSVVNMTEKLRCCQLDLGRFFLAWLERFIQRNHKKKMRFFLSFFATIFNERKLFSSK